MQSDSTRNANRVMLTINTLIVLFFIFGYSADYFKGESTLPYILTLLSILLIPILIALYIYFRNRTSEAVKYITLTGHIFLYIFVMVTTDNQTTFAYCFPIILMYYQYFDLGLMIISCTSISLVNIAKAAYLLFVRQQDSAQTTTDYTVQLATVIMFSYALIVSTRISKRYNKQNLDAIQSEKQKQEAILSGVLKIAAVMSKNSRDVQAIVDELASGTEVISNAVAEITGGVAQTSESIQNQSNMTKNIHALILDTSKLSEKMHALSDESAETLNEGISHVRELSEKTTVVREKSRYAYDEMHELMNKAHEIQNIARIITGISEQTNMLSLNATIEAARAAEHGHGFAVVANEIRKLSMQSKESSANIAEVLKSLETKASSTSDAVALLKETNDQQTELILSTRQVFENLSEKMGSFNENVRLISHRMDDIIGSNNRIIDSINEISAVSQESTANAEEAGAMTNMSKERSIQARLLVSELIETSNAMNKYL